MPNSDTSVRKARWILLGFAVTESAWVLLNLYSGGWRFIRYLGFVSGRAGGVWGWTAAVIVTLLFVRVGLRLPSVRGHLLRLDSLKVIAFGVAVGAGILEEVVFRRWTMDWVQGHGGGAGWQVLASGLCFGAVHGVWGLFGRSPRAAVGATVSTGALGAMLAVVYLLAGRSLAPCIAAHFTINLLIEPGLALAAVRGEMVRTTRVHETTVS
jgi:hypothetical protein